jgi:hypothetical protein
MAQSSHPAVLDSRKMSAEEVAAAPRSTRSADELHGYTMTKGALHLPVDREPPKSLVENLIEVRLEEIRGWAPALAPQRHRTR